MRNLVFILIVLTVFSCKTEKQQGSKTLETQFDKPITYNLEAVANANLHAGELIRLDNFPSNYITPRPVDIWLPKNYSDQKKYAVLYMHDGQMLFDSTTTWNKQEWKVDEWATQLMDEEKTKDFIVVAIHNIPQIRWQDLFPEKAFNFINEIVKDSLVDIAGKRNIKLNGDNYLRFLVEELKPIIDSSYPVFTDREHTFVMGSSMGGLMSMYAISEYPTVFGAAACVSTHWVGGAPTEENPYPDAIFSYMEANLPNPDGHRLYFDYGNKTLDQHYPQYAPRVDKILQSNGYTDNNYKNLFFEGTDHSENSWNKRLDQPLIFLLKKTHE